MWLAGVIAVVSAAGTFATYVQGLNAQWLSQPWQQGIVIIAVIVLSALLACQRVPTTQYVIKTAVVLICAVVALLGLSTLIWLLSGHLSATDFHTIDAWKIVPSNYSYFGLITLLYLGVNVPLNMGGELKAPRVVLKHLLWGTIIVFGSYLLVTVALLVVRGQHIFQAAVLPFEVITTVDVVLGKVLGNITAICILAFFVVAPIVYTSTSARIIFAASVDKCLPPDLTTFLGKLNRHRVPANAIIVQSCIAAAFTAFAFMIIPYLHLGQPINIANEVFYISSAAVTIIWALATVFLFVDLLVISLRDRTAFQRSRIFPLPLIWGSIVLGPIACVLSIGDTIFYSWIPSLIDNSSWLLWVGLSTVAVIVLSLTAVLGVSMVAEGSEMWREVEGTDIDFEQFREAIVENSRREANARSGAV